MSVFVQVMLISYVMAYPLHCFKLGVTAKTEWIFEIGVKKIRKITMGK